MTFTFWFAMGELGLILGLLLLIAWYQQQLDTVRQRNAAWREECRHWQTRARQRDEGGTYDAA